MKASDEEYMQARSFLRSKLAEPDAKVENWLNSIVDDWIASRKARRRRRTNAQ